MPSIAEQRPPYVNFERRGVHDTARTLESGHYATKDVDYAIITPAGSKDRIEREVDVWFTKLAQDVRAERFPSEWLQKYKHAYSEWKEGREPPLTGTDIRQWPLLTPAQLELMLHWKVRTIEDLAEANEETIGRFGMGGRVLKDKAVTWLKEAKSIGISAEKVTQLEQENRDLKATVDRQQIALEQLRMTVEGLKPAAPTKL